MKKILLLAPILILLTCCTSGSQKYYNQIKEHENLSSLFDDETIHRIADICLEDKEGKNTELKFQKLEQDVIKSMATPDTTVGQVITKRVLLEFAYSICEN